MSPKSPKSEAPERLLTIGAILRETGEPMHRIEYVIRSRGIKPVGVAGIARVFDRAAVDQIKVELKRMDLRAAKVARS